MNLHPKNGIAALATGLIIACALGMVNPAPATAASFLYNLPILDAKAISNLSDQDLKDRYVKVLIELEAAKIFHEHSGFQPEEYTDFRKMLFYEYNLKQEFIKRKLPVPKL